MHSRKFRGELRRTLLRVRVRRFGFIIFIVTTTLNICIRLSKRILKSTTASASDWHRRNGTDAEPGRGCTISPVHMSQLNRDMAHKTRVAFACHTVDVLRIITHTHRKRLLTVDNLR